LRSSRRPDRVLAVSMARPGSGVAGARERGTHEQLLARAGLYAWLWHVQSRDEALASARSA